MNNYSLSILYENGEKFVNYFCSEDEARDEVDVFEDFGDKIISWEIFGPSGEIVSYWRDLNYFTINGKRL